MKPCRPLLPLLLPLTIGLATLFYQGPGHRWARAHLGDTLVVAFLYALLRLLSPWSCRTSLMAIALFSVIVEFGQCLPGANQRGTAMRLLFGSHFDPLDFVYYALGLLLALCLDFITRSKVQPQIS